MERARVGEGEGGGDYARMRGGRGRVDVAVTTHADMAKSQRCGLWLLAVGGWWLARRLRSWQGATMHACR